MSTRTYGLRIKGHNYVVLRSPLPPASDVELCYALVKRRGRTYFISKHRWGCECTCGDFEFRRNHLDHRGCKHILALLQWGFL